MADFGHSSWGPAWNKLRDDVNQIAWLLEELKQDIEVQMGVISDAILALTSAVGIDPAIEGPTNDSQRPATVPLDDGRAG